MIAHIVLFTPRADLSSGDRRSFAKSVLHSLQSIPGIQRAVIGRTTNIDAGYERAIGHDTYQYAAVLEFETAAALVKYLNHPVHAMLGEQFGRLCDSALVVEVDARDLESLNADDLV